MHLHQEDKRFNGDCWDSWVAVLDVVELAQP